MLNKISILLCICLFMISCATLETKPDQNFTETCPSDCPPEDIIILDNMGSPVMIPEGGLIPENYFTIQEWKDLYDEYKQKYGL